MLSPLETEESRAENENKRTDSPNTEITAKQNTINTATQNLQNSNEKTESDKRKLKLLSYLVVLWVRTLKAGKCQAVLTKLW